MEGCANNGKGRNRGIGQQALGGRCPPKSNGGSGPNGSVAQATPGITLVVCQFARSSPATGSCIPRYEAAVLALPEFRRCRFADSSFVRQLGDRGGSRAGDVAHGKRCD